MWYRLFLLAVLFTASECWLLNVSNNTVAKQISSNASLECVYNGNDNGYSKFSDIFQIRILKFNNQWDIVAKLSALHPTIQTSLNPKYAEVTGHVERPSNTFLKINFSPVTSETIGKFYCEIEGYGISGVFQTVPTDPVVISEREINYEDILDIIQELKKKEENDNISDQLELKLLKTSINLLKTKEKTIGKAIVRNAKVISSMSEEHQQIKSSVSNVSNDFTRELLKLRTEIQAEHEEMKISLTNTSNELFSQIDAMKEEERATHEKHVKQVEKSISNIISTEISDKIESFAHELVTLREEMVKQKQTIVDDTKAILRKDPTQVWPAGAYAILKPKSGCPSSLSFDWVTGSIRITTRAGVSNADKLSNPSHMSGAVLQHDNKTNYNFVFVESCVKPIQSDGPSWPPGRYCIQPYNGISSEVSGFNFGYIQLDRYNTGSHDITGFRTWSALTNEFTRIGFWCRQDGSASSPIVLPSKDPFFLYRFDSICQSVKGMHVTNEWVYFDTMMQFDLYNNEWHPDGEVKGVKIMLCYYTPQ